MSYEPLGSQTGAMPDGDMDELVLSGKSEVEAAAGGKVNPGPEAVVEVDGKVNTAPEAVVEAESDCKAAAEKKDKPKKKQGRPTKKVEPEKDASDEDDSEEADNAFKTPHNVYSNDDAEQVVNWLKTLSDKDKLELVLSAMDGPGPMTSKRQGRKSEATGAGILQNPLLYRKRIRVEDALDLYFEAKTQPDQKNSKPGMSGKWKTTTYTRYKSYAKNQLKPILGRYWLDELTHDILVEYADKLRDDDYEEKTIEDSLILLHGMMKWKCPYLLQTLEFPDISGKSKETHALSESDCAKLLRGLMEYIPFSRKALGIWVVFSTGIREGELCGIQYRHIDLDRGILTIDGTVSRVPVGPDEMGPRTRMIRTEPKAKSSNRTIFLDRRTREILRDILGNEIQNENFYLVSGTEKIPDPRTLSYMLKKIAKEFNLDEKHITMHQLRHTFATNAVHWGTDVKLVSNILGHRSVQITYDRYVHNNDEVIRGTMEDLGEKRYNLMNEVPCDPDDQD